MKTILIAIVLVSTSHVSARDVSDQHILRYFEDIAIKQEYGRGTQTTKKWVRDMRIYCDGMWPKALRKELDVIIQELNALTRKDFIQVVPKKGDANYIVFIGSPKLYVSRIEPGAKKYVDANFGLFWINWNGKREITSGSMYVDPKRANTLQWQKHLLREELTQSLGLMNDSNRYKDSIFFGGVSYVTQYSKLDRTLIRLLYDPAVKPNMSAATVKRVIQARQLLKKIKGNR